MKNLPILELMMAESLPDILLDIDAGTGYEEFVKSILKICNENGISGDLAHPNVLCNMEVYPNGELYVFVDFLNKRHEYIIPKGSWMKKNAIKPLTDDEMNLLKSNICLTIQLHAKPL